MELAGLGIGVAGLAGLFSTCIDCFKLIQQGRYLGKDYVLLETKFSNQKLRLATWGRACGMMDPEGYDTRLDDEGLRPCIEATLTQLFQLFKDGKQLKKKYGLKEDQGGQRARPFLGAGLELERLSATSYGQKFQELMNRTKKIQQGARLRDSGMWAIEDKSKFTELVQHLKDLIDDLEGLTRYLDVGDRQRDMIQAEVESIAEFDILENIEEARLGRIDAVSDAASLQLWKLRDQFLIGGKTAEGSKQTRMDEVSAASSDKEWDVLPGQNESVGTVGDEMRYQVLHRVRCANEVAALIFLDKPSYLAGQQHEDQWAFLDPDKPTQEEQINHLRGRRNIPSLEAYRQQNRQLQFVVLHEYRCCDILPVSRIIPPPPTGQCVRLLSEELCAALRGVRKTSGELSLYPDFKVDLELQAPYMWFYQSRMLFLHTNDVNSVYQESIRAFAGVICGLMEPEYAKVDVLLARKAISA
ncbi:hypothetical protein M7I_2387 [Glarea lozoyensis 74030]|uniref:Prion-inhibition and propagation HeLo domain-containing protein n=1 Tax=Glarea lozoyensis (strain ATCC 74030 / MF5533) TaxID=1104152 RepID=H0EIM7_GLAL7|nr:hypothetical protein M7I_2387 [Glarea lozoyensis 74030]